ncbi:MAG: class I tRNA ligase family protein, partial [Bacteroidales bacterium]|nr:class I tRNA ligase family protein [Bacteroidales bacterium]
PGNPDIKYYYPTNDLITAPEILFFWVARMIIAGYEYMGDKPFRNVYLTGLVRDQYRRKMSKSLGNSPEPLELIEKYGADGVRVGMMLCSPAGNDLLYDDSLPEQGRNFANKIWNAFRLVKSWKVDDAISQPEYCSIAVKWMNEVLKKAVAETDTCFRKFRISEALMVSYRLFWDEFSGWFLEIIKPPFKSPVDRQTYNAAITVFDQLLRLIHPFMPFITEEIWHMLEERKEGESLMISRMPETRKADRKLTDQFEYVKEIISSIRTIRADKQIPRDEKIELLIKQNGDDFYSEYIPVIVRMAGLSRAEIVTAKQEGTASFMVKTTEFYVPLGSKLDTESERTRIKTDLDYYRGFLESVMKKLNNEKFMMNAPAEVKELEMKKKNDAETKIRSLEEALKLLEKSQS